MSQTTTEPLVRAGAFASIAQVDRAIGQLAAAGFSKDQMMVVGPAKLRDSLATNVPQVQPKGRDEGNAVATGGALGATLGGLAFAATVLTAGAGLGAAIVLVASGAIAGGFSNLIVSKGYEGEADDHIKKAVDKGWIVVGVEMQGEDRSAMVDRILTEAGAVQLESV